MERDWERRHPPPDVAPGALAAALRPYAAGRTVTACEALPGGKINGHLRVRLEEPAETVVVRIYLGVAPAARKEAALLRRLRGSVPLPRLLGEGAIDVPGRGRRPFLLLSWVPGTTLDLFFAAAPDAALARAGAETGAAMAAVHANPQPALGFLDERLLVREPMGHLPDVWAGYIRDQAGVPRVAARLGEARCARIEAFVEAEAPALAPLDGRYTLLHADCKPVNVRVDAHGGLTGLMDWEFAWAGPPLFDWGQMLRWPLPATFEDALVTGYLGAGGTLEAGWRRRARLLDVMNLMGFLDWRSDRVRVFEDVLGLLDATLAPS